ncbi:hypothetical protein ACH9EU_00755 [Kocuria sp. M1R5S2]|uniref:hypothetical protein n=1 Tax=Kocuria rhizosphaerae TaxID=3376285 RepID=UPI0037BC23DD
MTAIRLLRVTTALAGVLLLSACAPRGDGGAATPSPRPPSTPDASVPSTPALPAEGLVVQVAHTGGFVTPEVLAARLPLVSVYADGRVITQGPQIEIFPPPALPNLQVRRVDAGAVPVLVDRALRAGVAETSDLGSPPVADLPSTRFTVVTREQTHVREVYALGAELPPGPPGEGPPDTGPPGGPDSGLSAEQRAARAELRELVRTLSDPASALPAEAVGEIEAYVPETVAGVVTAWTDPQHELEHRPVPWPGPPLPGEPLHEGLGLSCVVAGGDQARAVLEAARPASTLTPWVSEDGRRWSVALRPLLPHEQGCADLLNS